MSIKKVFSYYWNVKLKQIEKIDLNNGSPFQKAHQKYLNKCKNVAQWPIHVVKKYLANN